MTLKKILSLLVVMAMLLSSVGITAMAEETAANVSVEKENNAPTNTTVTENETLVVSNEEIAAPAITIGGTGYDTLTEALNAAKTMTDEVVVEIYDKVTLSQGFSGTYDSITFVGKDTDAEIYLDVQGYITANGGNVAFKDLKLSKSEGGYITNAGFMNLAFGVYEADSVVYTNCVFANGAYASFGKNTFEDCTFYRSHDRYGLWAYGSDNILVDGCTFADFRGIKMYDENKGANNTTVLTVKNTDFSVVNNKPAIVLTYGRSVTLEGNTYSSTGVFELDNDPQNAPGTPNGTTITSDNPEKITCVDYNGNACGVLVDGKIYTSVSAAAEAAAAGSTVTLLHNSSETVELAEGVILDKNGFAAEGVTVKTTDAVAMVGDVTYSSLQAAIDAASENDTITVLCDVEETITSLKGNIVSGVEGGITITGKYNDWVYAGAYFTIGEGVTFKTPALFMYSGKGIINGKVIVDAYYQRYAGSKLTINEPGNLTVLGDGTIIRYTDNDANAGIYINGDNNDATVGLKAAVIYFYQGMISAKDATIEVSTYWQRNTVDNAGSANLLLDNSKMKVTVNEHNFEATGNSTVTLMNNSQISLAGGFAAADTATISIDGTSSVAKTNGQGVFAAKNGNKYYTSLASAIAAAESGDTVTIIADISDTEVTVDKDLTITGDKTLNNVTISGSDGIALTVSNLTFTGDSWINSKYAKSLTVSGVTANVTPTDTKTTNSRAAFICLGDSEHAPLELTVENCKIVTSGDRTNPILGWAPITKATISGNTFGSADSYQNNSDSVKIMGIAEGAVLNFTGNTVYSNYNGIVLHQNVTRDNAYTANFDGNTFMGGADHIWISIENGNVEHGTINVTGNNTVNGEKFTADYIKAHTGVIKNWTSYAGVDVVVDENGKVTRGTLAFMADGIVSEDCTAVKQKNGTHLVGKLPQADVKKLGAVTVTDENGNGDYKFNGSYFEYDLIGGTGLKSVSNPFEMNVAMEFIAKDTVQQAAQNAFGQYTTDFFIQINGLANGSFVGKDCYLAGYYPTFEKWVKIPLDGFTVEEGVVYPVITSAGFDFSYQAICESVGDFICGMYLSKDVLESNPDIQVNLTLGLSENADEAQKAQFTTVDGYTYNKDDFAAKAPELSGSGTEEDPYLINNIDELILFRDSVNSKDTKYNAPNVYVALAADIDMSGVDWSVNIGDDCAVTFDGIFDGKNHKISNLTSAETTQKTDGYVCTGLFGAIYGTAQIKNLTIENATINTGDFTGNNAGIVVGFVYSGKGSVENVKVTGDIKVDAKNVYAVGSIVGYAYYGAPIIKNCSVEANDGSYIKAVSCAGGIVGYGGNADVINSTVKNISIEGAGLTGGVAGLLLADGSVQGATVENTKLSVTKELWVNSAAVAVGTIAGEGVSVSDVTYENVTANEETVSRMVGSAYAEKPSTVVPAVHARIADKYYTTLNKAIADVKEGETIEILEGEFNLGTDVYTVDKAITIKGAGKEKTVLNFTSAQGTSAFEIKSDNVTISDLTIAQTKVTADTWHITVPRGDTSEGYYVEYSDATIENVLFKDGKYAMCVAAEDIVINGCDFENQSSSNIQIFAVQGDSRITNNTFTTEDGGKYAIFVEGGTDGNAAELKTSGTLTIKGNTSTDVKLFFIFNQYGYTENLTLNIEGNVISGCSNKPLAFYTPTGETGNEFEEINVNNNVFKNLVTGRPVIKDERANENAAVIDLTHNYFGSEKPDFDALVKSSFAEVYPYYADEELTILVNEETELFEFWATTATLGNSLSINFYVNEDYLDGEDYYAIVVHDLADGTTRTEKVPYSKWQQRVESETVKYRLIPYDGLAAKQVADELHVTIYDSQDRKVSEVYTDSLKAYAMRGITKYDSMIDKLSAKQRKTLTALVDMLNYAAAAQVQFNYNTDALANAQIDDYQKYATATINVENKRVSDLNYNSTTLTLENQIKLNAYFNNITEGMSAKVSYTDHYENAINYTVSFDEFIESNGYYGVCVDELVIADSNQDVTITIYDSEGNVYSTLVESMNSYLRRAIDARGEDSIYGKTAKFTAAAYDMLHTN